MRVPGRALAAAITMAAATACCTIPLAAQEPQQPPSSSPTARTATPAPRKNADAVRRLPNYYGQIGLSVEQRESVYKIVTKHQKKIEALQKQIADARAEMMKECESVLTDTQKQLLEQRRQISGRDRARTISDAASPAHN